MAPSVVVLALVEGAGKHCRHIGHGLADVEAHGAGEGDLAPSSLAFDRWVSPLLGNQHLLTVDPLEGVEAVGDLGVQAADDVCGRTGLGSGDAVVGILLLLLHEELESLLHGGDDGFGGAVFCTDGDVGLVLVAVDGAQPSSESAPAVLLNDEEGIRQHLLSTFLAAHHVCPVDRALVLVWYEFERHDFLRCHSGLHAGRVSIARRTA